MHDALQAAAGPCVFRCGWPKGAGEQESGDIRLLFWGPAAGLEPEMVVHVRPGGCPVVSGLDARLAGRRLEPVPVALQSAPDERLDMAFRDTVANVVWLVRRYRGREEPLRSYLDRLPEKTVRQLHTLVCFGLAQDAKDLVACHVRTGQTTPDREAALRFISEHVHSLDWLLPHALQKAMLTKFDFDREIW